MYDARCEGNKDERDGVLMRTVKTGFGWGLRIRVRPPFIFHSLR